jgi:hypothetical protein
LYVLLHLVALVLDLVFSVGGRSAIPDVLRLDLVLLGRFAVSTMSHGRILVLIVSVLSRGVHFDLINVKINTFSN